MISASAAAWSNLFTTSPHSFEKSIQRSLFWNPFHQLYKVDLYVQLCFHCKSFFVLLYQCFRKNQNPHCRNKTIAILIFRSYKSMSNTTFSTRRPASAVFASTASDNSSSTSYETNRLSMLLLAPKKSPTIDSTVSPPRSVANSALVQSFGRYEIFLSFQQYGIKADTQQPTRFRKRLRLENYLPRRNIQSS